jgi:hypothetical protein
MVEDYIVRIPGYLACRIISKRRHNGQVQVQFLEGRRMWFPADRVRGAP